MNTSREIKFRAWDGEKMYGWEWNAEDISQHISGRYDNDYKAVMQYTGLEDQNGKEIYEGDILRIKSFKPEVWEVTFDRGGFCIRDRADADFYPDGKYAEDGEVIGNIYENPELLP